TAPGGFMAGFVDLHEVLGQVRARLDEDDQQELDQWAPVVSLLEATTLRGELSGRTVVVRWTLHTSGEHGLTELTQALVKVAGAELATKRARERRRQGCDELVDHILALMKTELSSPSFDDQQLDRRFELLDECRKDETTDAEID